MVGALHAFTVNLHVHAPCTYSTNVALIVLAGHSKSDGSSMEHVGEEHVRGSGASSAAEAVIGKDQASESRVLVEGAQILLSLHTGTLHAC